MTEQSVSKQFPPISTLFNNSWAAFKGSILNLFILGIVYLGFFAVLGIVFFIIAIPLGILTFAGGFQTENIPALISSLSTFAVLIVVFIILAVILFFAEQASSILFIANYNAKPSFGATFKKGLSYIWKLLLLGLFTGFIVMGGYFLFIIPGIFFSILFIFAPFEIVLNNQSVLSSMRRSVKIVMSHFWEVFLRVLLWTIITFILALPDQLMGFIASFTKSTELALFLNAASLFISLLWIVVTWYGACYTITLYKQAAKGLENENGSKILWSVLISIVGWIVGIILIATLGSFIFLLIKNTKNTVPTTENASYVPSSCGLSLLIPNTKQLEVKDPRRWVFEESRVEFHETSIFNADTIQSSNPQSSFFFFKNVDDPTFEEESQRFKLYPGFEISCVDNTRNLSQSEFRALVLSSKDRNTKLVNSGSAGAVKVDLIRTSPVDDKSAQETFYLTVSEDGKKLIKITVINPGLDLYSEQIKEDIDTIWNNLKYTNTANITSPSPTAFQAKNTNSNSGGPSCTRYNIREGEFASNKCYPAADYEDLVYYINQFNNAAFSYDSAVADMNITCNGSDFFKSTCEEDKVQKAKAEQDMSTYRKIIQEIIAKGK